MGIQASPVWKNLFGKENTGKTIFDKLAKAVKITGNTGENGSEAAENGTQKIDGFSIQTELMEYLDPTAGLSEEEKKAYGERIMQKLRSGKKLTSEEMNYLRAKNPQLYAQAARVQAMRENLKNQLENCRSKEEAEKVYGNSVSMVSDKDPMKECIVAAYDDVMKEFKKTDRYQSLPEKEEDAKEGSGKNVDWAEETEIKKEW